MAERTQLRFDPTTVAEGIAHARELAVKSANSPFLRVWPERSGLRALRRLTWWWATRDCECHWQEPYGEVVMAGCPLHD